MEQLAELPPFLRHDNPQVRLQACQMLGGLATTEQQRNHISKLDVVKPLRDLMTDADSDVRTIALSVLVNLSDHDALRSQMVSCGVISVCFDNLRDKSTTKKHLITMLLSNLSLGVDACKKILQQGKPLEGLNMRLLIQWFNQEPSLHAMAGAVEEEEKDPFGYAANVLSNITQIACARALVMDKDRGILKSLLRHLNSEQDCRRLGVLRSIKNCSMDLDVQEYLMSPELGLFARLLIFLVGPQTVDGCDEEDREGLLPEVKSAILKRVRWEPNNEVRLVILDIILLWLRNKKNRKYLKACKTYIVLRELHKWEKELPDHPHKDTIDEQIEGMVHYLILDEGAEEQPAPKIEEIEEEEAPAEVKVEEKVPEKVPEKEQTPEEAAEEEAGLNEMD